MPPSDSFPDLSRAEYDILHILWKHGRQSVREAHEKLQSSHNWAYTTTKTMMDRMVAKGLLMRHPFHGVFLYQAMISRPMGMAKWIQFFADRVLEVDSTQVVSLFAQNHTLDAKEIAELERLLEQLREEND